MLFTVVAQSQVPVRKRSLWSPAGSIWKRTGSRQLGGSHQYGFPLPVKAAFYVPVKHSECIVCLRGTVPHSPALCSPSAHITHGPAALKGPYVDTEEGEANVCKMPAVL